MKMELTTNELFLIKTALGWSYHCSKNEKDKKEINQIIDKLEKIQTSPYNG